MTKSSFISELNHIDILDFKLIQNEPNPFNLSTAIGWQLPVKCHVLLKVYDAVGKDIETLVDEDLSEGYYSTLYLPSICLPKGIYFYRIKAGEFVDVKKMVLLK
jgi:hypothetical protein